MGDQATNRLGPLRSDLEVVVDGRHLSVHREPELGLGEGSVNDVVHEVDQTEAESLEGLVPLAVPVGVGDEPDRRDRLRVVRHAEHLWSARRLSRNS